MPQIVTKGLSIQNDLTKKERVEENKLLDEARANEALDGEDPVQGQRPTMGTENSQNEAPRRGRVGRKNK